MAAHNRLWGAERIRGELLKLASRVSKRAIQKYMKHVRPKRARGQTWRTFLRTHAAEVWACDCLQGMDLFFRPLFAFFMIELKSRKVIHVNVTRTPTDPWVARTAPRSDSVWANPKIAHPGYRQEIWAEFCASGHNKWDQGASNAVSNSPGECCLRTLSLKREAGMPGCFPDLPREATLPASESVCRVLQSSPTASRAWAAASGAADAYSSSISAGEQGARHSGVGWITP